MIKEKHTYILLFYDQVAVAVPTILGVALMPVLVWCGRAAVAGARGGRAPAGTVAAGLLSVLPVLGAESAGDSG